MRASVFLGLVLLCGVATAETHIGFEASLHPSIKEGFGPASKEKIVRVDDFYATGKARASGLWRNEIVVAIDKAAVKHPKTIAIYCKRKKPGDTVVLTVKRPRPAVGQTAGGYALYTIEVELVEGVEMRKDGLLDR